MNDPFVTLHLQPDAPDEVIAAAHKALVKLYHPDVAGTSTTARMAAINAAYDLIRKGLAGRYRITGLRPEERQELERLRDEIAWLRRSATVPPAALITMPFGKHKGQPLGQLDSGYLAWIVNNIERSDIRHDAAAVLQWRRSRR